MESLWEKNKHAVTNKRAGWIFSNLEIIKNFVLSAKLCRGYTGDLPIHLSSSIT